MLTIHSPFHRIFNDFENDLLVPYWRDADHSSFKFSDTLGEIVNNDKKFGLQIDVSHFKPENLKVNLNGNELTIEGEQEVKHEHGHSKRSFSRMVIIPDDADLTSLSSSISNEGKLTIEASKKANTNRSIPINFVNKKTPIQQ